MGEAEEAEEEAERKRGKGPLASDRLKPWPQLPITRLTERLTSDGFLGKEF